MELSHAGTKAMKQTKATNSEGAPSPTPKALAPATGSALRADADTYDEACSLIERYKRTLRVLIAGDFITDEKLEQAWEIAGWK